MDNLVQLIKLYLFGCFYVIRYVSLLECDANKYEKIIQKTC